MYGETEQYWWDYSGNSSLDQSYFRAFRAEGIDVMKYPVENFDYVNYEELLLLQQNGGKAIYSVQNYKGGIDGHAMTVKKIKYVPNKRFDIQIINPEFGTTKWIKNFDKYNMSYGTEPHLWYIYR